MKRKKLIQWITGNGILIALTVVLTLISNNIPIAGVTINLALIPIAVAALIYGSTSALFVGLVNGAFVVFAAQSFMAINPVATVFVCLLKSGFAGLFASLIFNVLKKKNEHIAAIIATISVPITNTSIFIIGSLLFFDGAFGSLISIFIGINFIVEFLVNLLLSEAIFYIFKTLKKENFTN